MPELTREEKLRLLTILLESRHGDLREQNLNRQGKGHFHVSGMGHEALAAISIQMQENDYIVTFYRDRALVLGRGVSSRQLAIDYFAKAKGESYRAHSRRKRTGFFLGDDGTAFQSHQLRRPEALSQRGRAEKMCGMRSAKEMEGTIDCGRTDQRIRIRQSRQRNQRTDSPRIFGCGKRAGPVSRRALARGHRKIPAIKRRGFAAGKISHWRYR